MTVKECYEQMGSDYEGVLGRMGSEAMIKRFALKFLQNPSFNNLKENLEKNDGEEAFRAAHTLKGVCLNLGFDELYEASAEITEKLRGKETAGSEDMFFCFAAGKGRHPQRIILICDFSRSVLNTRSARPYPTLVPRPQ